MINNFLCWISVGLDTHYTTDYRLPVRVPVRNNTICIKQ